MDGLERGDNIELCREPWIRGVPDREFDPVGDAGLSRVAPRLIDRRRIKVKTVDRDLWIRLGDADAGPTGSAADVRDQRGRVGAKASVELGYGREPLRAQQLQKPRPVQLGDRAPHILAVRLVRHAASAPERLE